MKTWIKEPLIVSLRTVARKKQQSKIPIEASLCFLWASLWAWMIFEHASELFVIHCICEWAIVPEVLFPWTHSRHSPTSCPVFLRPSATSPSGAPGPKLNCRSAILLKVPMLAPTNTFRSAAHCSNCWVCVFQSHPTATISFGSINQTANLTDVLHLSWTPSTPPAQAINLISESFTKDNSNMSFSILSRHYYSRLLASSLSPACFSAFMLVSDATRSNSF